MSTDIYVVHDGGRLVAASTKMQGAELIRADEATRLATNYIKSLPIRDDKEYSVVHRYYYDGMTVTNTELHDDD